MITQSLRWVTTEIVELPIYEGLSELSKLFQEFEENFFELKRILALDIALKATPARWWTTHK